MTLWYHTKYINSSGQSECSCSYPPTQVFYSPRPRLLRVKDNTPHSLQISVGWAQLHLYYMLNFCSCLRLHPQHIVACERQHSTFFAILYGMNIEHLSKLPPTTQHGTHVKRHLCTFFTTLHGMSTFTQLHLAKLLLLSKIPPTTHHGTHAKRQLCTFFATIHEMSSKHFHTQTGILLNLELLLS